MNVFLKYVFNKKFAIFKEKNSPELYVGVKK